MTYPGQPRPDPNDVGICIDEKIAESFVIVDECVKGGIIPKPMAMITISREAIQEPVDALTIAGPISVISKGAPEKWSLFVNVRCRQPV